MQKRLRVDWDMTRTEEDFNPGQLLRVVHIDARNRVLELEATGERESGAYCMNGSQAFTFLPDAQISAVDRQEGTVFDAQGHEWFVIHRHHPLGPRGPRTKKPVPGGSTVWETDPEEPRQVHQEAEVS
jgi:hypothetical protein